MSSIPPPPLGKQRAPRVVAELGRPETAAETAARKAESSRAHRANQTAFNLTVALVVSVAIVVLLVLAVPRDDGSHLQAVDYQKVASEAQAQQPETLAAPAMPAKWTSNKAQISPAGSDGVGTWYVGFLTPDTQFIGLTQGFKANATWVANELDDAHKTSEKTVGGLSWTVYDQRAQSNTGNLAYAMVATEGASTIVLAGTAPDSDFDLLATRVAAQVAG